MKPTLSRAGFPADRHTRARLICLLMSVVVGAPAMAASKSDGDEQSVRLYNAREERRDAGLEHELASGLTASGLLDMEASREYLSGRSTEHENKGGGTVQLGLKASPFERVQVEAVLEIGTEKDELIVDEAAVELDFQPWGLALGRQYLPFGVYINRFATGPLIEFAETRATSATLSYEFTDHVEISASLYRGRAHSSGNRSQEANWALGIEAQPSGRLSLGASYLDDLADADGRLLADENHRFSHGVSAVGVYAIWAAESFEISFEALGATQSFVELPGDRNQPAAWNLEYVRFTHRDFDWALRVEGSKELEDSPNLRYGAAASFRLYRQVSLTLEILHGRFKGELALNDNHDPFKRTTQAGLLLSVAF